YSETATAQPEAPAPQSSSALGSTPGIGFIGAGSFAQKFLIPFAQKIGNLVSVVTSRGVTAKSVGEKFRFRAHSTDVRDVLSNPAIDTVFIATRHDTHAGFAAAALDAGKNVFVEKPLAINEDELAHVMATARRRSDCRFMVGYNRRFSPLSRRAREVF